MDMSGFLLPIREVPDVPWNPHLVPTTGDLGEPRFFYILQQISNARTEKHELSQEPSQGINLVARNLLFYILIIFSLSQLLEFIKLLLFQILEGFELISFDHLILDELLSAIWFILYTAGLLYIGGLTWIQHFFLLLMLRISGKVPSNYSQFLAYCNERRILHNIGSGYRFIHRELMDYFLRS